MAESHKTLQVVILRHFVSVRRSGGFGRGRKTAIVKICRAKKARVGAGGEHKRAQDDAYGTEVTVWSCCEKQYATFDISIFWHGSEAFGTNVFFWCCLLCVQVSFGNWETKETLKSYNFDPKALEHVRILIYRTWPIWENKKVCKSSDCPQKYSKTNSAKL